MQPQPGARPAILVDLDGPLTRLFPHPSHLELAGVLDARLHGPMYSPSSWATDHVQVLREAAFTAPDLLAELAELATTAELRAAAVARPAPGARALLEQAGSEGYAVAVVSNNDEVAVRLALVSCGLAHLVDHVAARHGAAVLGLKPAPTLLRAALAAVGSSPADATFFGDSVSDVLAGRAAGVRTVGVSADPVRCAELAAAGAVAVVADLSGALDRVTRSHPVVEEVVP